MEAVNKTAIYQACLRVLRPIASMLLRCGMTWKEFSDLSKAVFVQTATEEFGIKGRPTNVSRVSILTGISRKEVKRQRELLVSERAPVRGKTNFATRVLSAWFSQDPEFLNENGEPLLLEESGPMPSFETLCDRYGGDIAMQTMLKELLKTKAVERQADGRLKVLARYYQPAVRDDENLLWASGMIGDLTETMNNNVFMEGESQPRFGGHAINLQMNEADIPEFQNFLDERGQTFLEEIDGWLTAREAKNSKGETEHVRLGVGLFAIQNKH